MKIMLGTLLWTGNPGVFISDLGTDDELSMNHQEMYAASLIQLFVMEKLMKIMTQLHGK